MRTIFLNSIKFNRSLVDGPGVRTIVFFQGCDLRCKGCHNKSAWDITKGTEVSVDDLVTLLKREVINKKVTISGGEPLMQKEGLVELAKKLNGFDIAVYTGHEISDVPKELLDNIKYIKTGSFKEELKTTTKPYVGSTNQEFRRVK
jgi:anaerobic ribonucleoside-triphosphate reductase activating protein